MATQMPPNRLREFRKQSGLTLREVAFTIRIDVSAAARYESRRQEPTLEVALRYEELYRVPVAELFPGMHATAARQIMRRLKILVRRLSSHSQADFRREQRLQWLTERLVQPMRCLLQSLGSRPPRILALDVHAASFGFAVLQDSDRLLDWGSRRSGKLGNQRTAKLAARLRFLFRLWQPSVMVIRQTQRLPMRTVAHIREIATAEHLPVRFLKAEKIRRCFGNGNGIRQREIVSLLAKRFPRVAGKQPRERRFYDSQPYHVSCLMALAAAMAYLLKQRPITTGS